MNRGDLIRRMILRAIADDYENVDQVIYRQCAAAGAAIDLTIERSDIVDALRGLIQEGLAKAYLFSSTNDCMEFHGMPPLDVIETDFKTYFYITKKGLEHHSTDTRWPFDDQDNLRPDWVLDGTP